MRRYLPLLSLLGLAYGENGLAGWLRFEQLASQPAREISRIVLLNATSTGPVETAVQELVDGIESLFGWQVPIETCIKGDGANVIVGTLDAFADKFASPGFEVPELIGDGYYLNATEGNTLILGNTERGTLTGAFRYLLKLAQGEFEDFVHVSNPDVPIRWVNQWDNMRSREHGYVERGYAGASIFFDEGAIRENLTRVNQYARLLASIGINGIVINNVNAESDLLKEENMDGLALIAGIFRPYGIVIGISCYFASPEDFGLSTSDPLDEDVIEWWTDITNKLYARIPDFGGYLIKADSEGQPGPLLYNRTLSDGANLFAKALRPHNGTVFFRAFIYDAEALDLEENWRDDRATQAAEYFVDMDHETDDNVVIQIKNGPIDFQVREPVSPLAAQLRETPVVMEFQISQEYLGQQAHTVYLAPQFKEYLNFDFRVAGQRAQTKDLLNGNALGTRPGGYAGVVNVGMNDTWLGNHLSMSNLWAFGQLAWDPSSDAEDMVKEWARLTFGRSESVVDVIAELSMKSWPAYENYTGNLGMLTNVDAASHFGPDPVGRVISSMPTRAYTGSIGIDRTVKNGSGFAGQYPSEVAAYLEEPETTPDQLLLFYHHVPYSHKLSTGQTVIQHIYDSHYAGAETAQAFVKSWKSLEDHVDQQRFEEVLFRLTFQAGHAILWRDAMTTFFANLTGIEDDAGRVAQYPWRIEAEGMDLEGYEITEVSPAVSASKGLAVAASDDVDEATASVRIPFDSGTYDVAVNYFDTAIGNSTWEVHVNNHRIGIWFGNAEYKLGHSPSRNLNGVSGKRITFPEVLLTKGDVLVVTGRPDGLERAALDYISLLPHGTSD